MQRCLQLAKLGAGTVAPNPMVGAVLVYNNQIIGEGYHQQYGQAHAEVNCINSVKQSDKAFIKNSTLYVSLEPCAHFGKTPPCVDLIITSRIPTVVIGCRDSFEQVNGKGIKKLQHAGITVITGVLQQRALDVNKHFFTFHNKKRPYLILKWAQTNDGFIAKKDFTAIKISNALSNRLVHRWRSEAPAILVGYNTALQDNPSLTNRYWSGNNPIRLVIDRQLQLPVSVKLFDGMVKTIVFNQLKQQQENNIRFHQLAAEQNLLPTLLTALYQLNIQSVLVEGGALLLQSFIDQGYWDEARIITNQTLQTGDGIAAPHLKNSQHSSSFYLNNDRISIYHPTTTNK